MLKQLKNSPIVYYVNETKQAQWILFLHAAFVNHQMFDKQLNYFQEKYNVLTLDIIGHGNSINTKKGDSIKQMSFWISEILKQENIKKIHLVGISLGAILVQDFATHYPEFVQSLVCFGGYNIHQFDVKSQKENNHVQMMMMFKALISIKWFAKANKKISAYTKLAQDQFYEMNKNFKKRSFIYLSTLKDLINKNSTYSRNYPLLIGCGEFASKLEIETVKKWQKNESSCELVIFKNAGHCVNMDVPQLFNETVHQFIYKNTK